MSCEVANPALTTCSGACADLQKDPQNCGECGSVCPQDRPLCQDGLCVPCEENKQYNQVTCNGECVQSDDENCAACGDKCEAPDICYRRECGACERIQGWGYCEGAGCRELVADEAHCGGCNQPCPANYLCASGNCIPIQ
jgi:hypothetical protein